MLPSPWTQLVHDAPSFIEKVKIFEWALYEDPRSFKLWYTYSQTWKKELSLLTFSPEIFSHLTLLCGRAISGAPFPSILIEWCDIFLPFDFRAALRILSLGFHVLPKTQHRRLWHRLEQLCQSLDDGLIARSLSEHRLRNTGLTDLALEAHINLMRLHKDFAGLLCSCIKFLGEVKKKEVWQRLVTDACDAAASIQGRRDLVFMVLNLARIILNDSAFNCSGLLKLNAFLLRHGEFENASALLLQMLAEVDDKKSFHHIYCILFRIRIELFAYRQVQLKVANAAADADELEKMGRRHEKALWAENRFTKSPSAFLALQAAERHAEAKSDDIVVQRYFRIAVQRALESNAEATRTSFFIAFARYFTDRKQYDEATELIHQALKQLDDLSSSERAIFHDVLAEINLIKTGSLKFIEGCSPQMQVEIALRQIDKEAAFECIWSLRYQLDSQSLMLAAQKFTDPRRRQLIAFAASRGVGSLTSWGRNVLILNTPQCGVSSIELVRVIAEDARDKDVLRAAAKIEEEYGTFDQCVDHFRRLVDLYGDDFFPSLVDASHRLQGAAGLRDLAVKELKGTPEKILYRGIEICRCLQTCSVLSCRALLKQIAIFADSRSELWSLWRDFEVANGTTETWEDMERCRRSVQHLNEGKETVFHKEVLKGLPLRRQ